MIKFKDLPKEIQERMLEEQVRQGNKRDESVFIKKCNASCIEGGFTWEKTKEDYTFWNEIIWEGNFTDFYKLYPKKEFPRMMLVGDDKRNSDKPRMVIHKIDDENCIYPYITVAEDDLQDYKNGEKYCITYYKFAKEIQPEQQPEPLEISFDEAVNEIAKLRGVKPEMIRIKKQN